MGVGDFVMGFDVWFHMFFSGPKFRIWRMTFLALVVAIWQNWNLVTFEHQAFSEDRCFELCCCDLTW